MAPLGASAAVDSLVLGYLGYNWMSVCLLP